MRLRARSRAPRSTRGKMYPSANRPSRSSCARYPASAKSPLKPNSEIAMNKPGRNDPCPCASGKKYRQCCGRFVERAAQTAVTHFNLALVLQSKDKINEAVEHYQQALSLRPDFPEALLNLGALSNAQGRLAAAVEYCQRALLLNPGLAEAHSNLGNALHAQGKVDAAVRCYRNALSLKPGYADAYLNLGNALYSQGDLGAALESYVEALSIDPNDVDAYNGLASVFLAEGWISKALEASKRSLRIRETIEAKALFVRCINNLSDSKDAAELRHLVVRAITEPWCRPRELVAVSVALVSSNRDVGACIERAATAWPQRLQTRDLFGPSGLAAASDDDLLRCLLENAPACDVELERFLTMARLAALDAAVLASRLDAPQEKALTFYSALARQCFINEYIYSYSNDEVDRARILRENVVEALESGTAISPLSVVAVAAYSPLCALPNIETILHRSWPESVVALLEQQVKEPLQERESRASVPRLTTVDDEISRLVQEQYEENPFPRWVKAEPRTGAMTVDAFLVREFSLPQSRHLGKSEGVNVLIAGCGTGQQSIQAAQTFTGVNVLAVDLSLSSLCYAKRKTEELGLKNVEYAQADILKLGSIGRMFDVIECVGVLHHLDDPIAGWRELLSLLQPGGFMQLGLYSELGRRDIVAAQRFVAAKGYNASAGAIRQCRQELLSIEGGRRFSGVTAMDDFYVTSGCRDLLFHVKEHRFTLPQIKDCLVELGLDFIGFKLQPRVVQMYRQRFPDDESRTNLDHWNLFEEENPGTFIGMYNFYIQKPLR
jgi:tetratricopeptide (TPR) repeat protein/2-polyprenyl-3-methyl-5-hydroxy-6-metoxy-1,4-benzoquinol methylase